MAYIRAFVLFSLFVAIGCNPEGPAIGDALSINAAPVIVKRQASGLCLSEHNSARSQNGKGPLTYDSKLEQAAKNHNNVMTSQNCFSHQCSGEPSLGDRVTKVGYRWRGVAENIAAGQADCKSVMNSWMNSSGHKANILGDYKNVGCTMSQCSNCKYRYYWTCVFGSPM